MLIVLIGALLFSFLVSIFLTPYVGKLAFKLGATDRPNHRKVHNKIMPRMGGLAIFLSFMITYFVFSKDFMEQLPFVIGACIIIVIGILDDIFELKAAPKFLGQIFTALIIVYGSDLQVEFINLPFGGRIEFGMFSVPFTVLWIVGIINAINLIDGLDGLAGGVSTIALTTIAVMAVLNKDLFVALTAVAVIGATLGFLKYNFHPAKIFMGDTGAMFLGYIIAIISLQGLFKNVTMISFIVPVIILGVPISDTFFAIIRRLVNKTPISAPDKSHLHHCLLNIGFTHKQTVILIYAMSASFGLAAIIFSFATLWGALLIVAILLISIEIIVEKIGLVSSDYQPLLKMFNLRNVKDKS